MIPKTNRIFVGDCVEVMKSWPDGFVQTCVTSPPYWGLRDYGVDGQLGAEKTPQEYVDKMVEVFREVKRVLRDDGTLWLNIGDTYAANRSYQVPDNKHKDVGNNRGMKVAEFGLKPKDLVGIPWMVAFALRADGWYLRSDIIWHKPNPMPESVTDRLTKAHEYIFLMSKSARYFYDAEAIKEETKRTVSKTQKMSGSYSGGSGRHDGGRHRSGGFVHGGRKNKRSVWTVTSKPYKGAHFATFPPDLIEPCILAGASEKGCCAKCGAGWERQTERPPEPEGLLH